MRKFAAFILFLSVPFLFAGHYFGGGSSGGTGILELNGLTADPQEFAVGTSGDDFAIDSTDDTHTWNLPDASATARGVVTTGAQTLAGVKTFSSAPVCSALTASKIVLTSGGKALSSSSYGEADLVLTSTDQTVAGVKTLSSAPILSSLTASKVVLTNGSKALASSSLAESDIVSLTGSQTLTNKTLTSPAITTPTGIIEVFTGHIEAPTAKPFILDQSAAYAYTVNTIISQCDSGTADFDLEINGTNVTGCASQQMANSEATDTCTAANSVAIGDTLSLNVTAVSSPDDCRFTIKVTR